MPVYSYECPKCHEITEAFRRVDERNFMTCECGTQMEIVILAAPNHPKEILPYFDKGLGCRVQDRSDRLRIMKSKGLKEAGDSDHPTTKWLKEVREQEKDAKADKRRKCS
jgi:putative FmdB family regulatory protein